MNYFENYHDGFIEGFYFSLSDDRLDSNAPQIDYGDIKSIGFADGYRHGISRLSVGKKNIVTSLLEEYIRNNYMNALNLHKDYEDKYVWYKSGFVLGVSDMREKLVSNDEVLNIVPDIDEDDIYSIGYYDGSCYYLNKVVNDKHVVEEDNVKDETRVLIEVSARECFRESYLKYSMFINNESKKK